MATQTYGGISAEQRTFYEGTLLKRLLPYTPMFSEGLKGSIPKHNGLVAQWRLFASLSLATTALTEGTPPSDTSLSVSSVTATVAQYGAWVKLSDLLTHQGIDDTWTETSGLLGEQAGQTLHTVLINVLAAGTSVRYASTAVSRVTVAAAMVFASTDIRKSVRQLRAAKVPAFPDKTYHALIHPNQAYDIQNDSDWKTVAQYVGGKAGNNGPDMILGDVNTLHGAKMDCSTDAPIFAGAGAAGIDVYGALLYGPRWFGIRDLSAQSVPGIDPNTNLGVRITSVPVDMPTKDDALGQFGVMGWKTSFVGKILQESRGVRLETAVTP